MGTSRLLRATWQKCQSPGGEPPENPEKIMYFHGFFSRIFWSKPIPKPPENPSDHFEPVSASLDHSQPILHRFYIFELLKKKVTFFSSFFEVFPIFSLFFELRRLWDHSQIVDLIFMIWMVSTRASETSKTPHS